MSFLVLIFMALLANGRTVVSDGDPSLCDLAFFRVDTRNPAHLLPPGVAADALNKRCEQGQFWPRFGVDQQPWGQIPVSYDKVNLVPGNAQYINNDGECEYNLLGGAGGLVPIGNILVAGTKYVLIWGATDDVLQIGNTFINSPGVGNQTVFVAANQTTLVPINPGGPNRPVTAQVFTFRKPVQCGYKQFNDPAGFNVTVLLTDDWRDNAAEDGGRGRAWKIQSGNVPVAIPLNGHDIYGTARLVPCKGALVLLRQQNERHYFPGANISPGGAAGTVQLNGTPGWTNGDAALFWADGTKNSALSGGAAPAPNSEVWVKNIGNNQVELYADSGLAAKYAFTGGIGRFYLERQSETPGFYGNGAPTLIAQPDALGDSLFDVGFASVPVDVFGTALSVDSKILTAPNHRLIPGDSVNYFHAGVPTALFVNPFNDNQITFFDTQVHALLAVKNGSTAGQQTVTFAAGDYVVKTGAGGLPAPPAREGYYTDNNQLVLVNGANNIWISDALDPLHGSPFVSSLTANLGEADNVVAVTSLANSNALIFLKQNSVLALHNLSGGSGQWELRNVTREYGCEAALSVVPWGSSIFFLSRRGMDRIEYSPVGGTVAPGSRAVSYDMQKYVNLIDWNNAANAVCETWNSRLFFAFPSRGQVPANTVNNTVLVLNFLNSQPSDHSYAWEGAWSGSALNVSGWARHGVFGEERLTFTDYDVNVNWFGDGALDLGQTAISDSLTTRIYTGGSKGRKVWQGLLLNWQTNNALLTITAQTPGYKEQTVLAQNFAYDRMKYGAGEGPDYNPATQVPPFTDPFRQDYSLAGPGELFGGQLDVHQDHNEPFRMRQDDWGVQIIIANTRGSARIQSVEVGGFIGPSSERSTV